MTPVDREVVIRRLERERPRSHFIRWSVLAFAGVVLYAFLVQGFDLADAFAARRLANVQRFLQELRPLPLQGRAWDSGTAARWTWTLIVTRAAPAALTTVAISIVAIVLAGCGAALLALPAARSVTSAEPYIPDGRFPSPLRRAAWNAVVWVTRVLLIFLRAVPEYMWAFVILAVLGPNVWAAVLSLALHNTGILGKLNAEVIENLDPRPMGGLRALGASRAQIALAAIRPAIVPRALLFFFYRWETCVREATVLGMLGILSLGFYIQDARARQYYDVMFALILTGSLIVIAGDLISAGARRAVRRSAR